MPYRRHCKQIEGVLRKIEHFAKMIGVPRWSDPERVLWRETRHHRTFRTCFGAPDRVVKFPKCIGPILASADSLQTLCLASVVDVF